MFGKTWPIPECRINAKYSEYYNFCTFKIKTQIINIHTQKGKKRRARTKKKGVYKKIRRKQLANPLYKYILEVHVEDVLVKYLSNLRFRIHGSAIRFESSLSFR